MRSITIDEKSISRALSGQLDLESIYENLNLPFSSSEAKCVTINDHGYILSRELQPKDALLTISLATDGPLSSPLPSTRQETLGRLLRCTMRLYTGKSRSIPAPWKPFHCKNRLSFQADRRVRSLDGGKTEAGRVILEQIENSGSRYFAFLLTKDKIQDLGLYSPDIDLLRSALGNVGDALASPEQCPPLDVLKNEVALEETNSAWPFAQFTLDDWYNTRLTSSQRKFIDLPLSGSARLIGPAGSGKTVALVVKCLRELIQFRENGDNKRFLLLTHASSTVDSIENMVLSMVSDLGFELLSTSPPPLVVTTLYTLANEKMRYELDGLTPVSLDGFEGKTFQADILNLVIEVFRNGDWIAYKTGCAEPFITYMEADKDSTERRFFLWELLNEFACVLDAEGVKSSPEKREHYLSGRRRNWMMVLQTREERQVVLSLYDLFRKWLRDLKAIGSDQMTTDFLNYLDSFRWEATRENDGYDCIFVDELHLFNRQERMIFRHLLRDQADTPVVFMAYDAKQSPRDTFLSLPNQDAERYDYWRDAKLGKVEKIELVDVFRYTPQITNALKSIDQSFPGQDLDDDWPQYSGISQVGNGPIPTVCSLLSTRDVYATVFQRAKNMQHNLGKKGRVAVLCASYEQFNKYLNFDFHKNDFYSVTSREEIVSLPHSRKKFIFSMPEYVAGLQFDTVLLLDVNLSEVPEGPYSAAALRKFASQVYLGASRAERILEIYASDEHGGVASLLTPAVLNESLREIDRSQLIAAK